MSSINVSLFFLNWINYYWIILLYSLWGIKNEIYINAFFKVLMKSHTIKILIHQAVLLRVTQGNISNNWLEGFWRKHWWEIGLHIRDIPSVYLKSVVLVVKVHEETFFKNICKDVIEYCGFSRTETNVGDWGPQKSSYLSCQQVGWF